MYSKFSKQTLRLIHGETHLKRNEAGNICDNGFQLSRPFLFVTACRGKMIRFCLLLQAWNTSRRLHIMSSRVATQSRFSTFLCKQSKGLFSPPKLQPLCFALCRFEFHQLSQLYVKTWPLTKAQHITWQNYVSAVGRSYQVTKFLSFPSGWEVCRV